ncbi:WRKY domain superfamily [Arabidopsis thaliana x Arabidopsis arenosa]|uniref:WRKY34 n=2 Tax=Arabidopsis TaxID=3701 RepID=A0A178UU02_ARATH|nr:WRKY domain superfamily [Arabidopsis thaliana x Arabidopsis arenosa]OAO97358.1 WRKY34 [Arabidopsis thaliana]
MAGIDNKAAVMGEWFDCSTTNHRKRSKAELGREFSLNYIKNEDSLQITFQESSRGALRERIAARSGFNAPWLNTEDILQSKSLTISSPGLSPATLLESPVFLSNPLLSPTTGKLSSVPSDKAKAELFDDITTSLAFQTISGSGLDPTNIALEPDDSQDYEERQLGGLGDSMACCAPADDGYNWRKYGQKLVKGSEYPRSYYKCTHPNCEAKKKVERSREGHIIEIIYTGDHIHSKPPPNRRSGIGSSGTGQDMQIDATEYEGFAGTNENIEWTSPVSAELEYGSHSGSMQVQNGTHQFGYGDAAADALYRDENEDDRTSHMSVSLTYDGEVEESESKRRKLEAYATETSGSTRASREPRVVVQTTSDIDILDDGYRWRKYGQKVVKGNPNPRSYYKCTANGCTVTKHVERASDDFKSVLTTYIGKHTHVVPAARNSSQVGAGSSGTLQGSLATQTHNHNVHYPMPHSRSEGLATANSSLFDFQSHLRHPTGFSVYIGQSELSDLSMPGLTIGQEKLTSLQAPDIGDPTGLMLQLAAQPKVEPVSPQQGLDLSASSLICREMLSRLRQI